MSEGSPLPTRREAWRSACADRWFVVALVLTVAATGAVLGSMPSFVGWVEKRPGVILADPLQKLFEPIDLTWPTFVLIYGGLGVSLVHFSRRPRLIVTGLQAYTLLTLFRILMMWLVPLDPPPAMLPLKDPFVEAFVGSEQILTRDLFFSGHTSLPFLMFLVARARWWRRAFLLLTIATGTCVTLQHVHYTIDVVVALFVAYGSYRIAVHIRDAVKAW